MNKTPLSVVAGLAAVLALAGCAANAGGSSTSPTAPGSSAPSSGQAGSPGTNSPAAAGQGAGSQIVGPVIITPGQTQVDVTVGRYVVFAVDDPLHTQVMSDNTDLLPVTQGHTDGTATFNPGGQAAKAGVVHVTITPDGGSPTSVTVTIS